MILRRTPIYLSNSVKQFNLNNMENGKQPILDNQFEDNKGLTKREYFAGLAMQGMASSDLTYEDIAHDAVKMADAILKELDKPKNEAEWTT